ncbi:ABC transporter [Solibacillus sp. R5-41]|uniref:ABC transporter permease n=1 Tax=Solibacillus sp. R5-41 TaxID=2048654 RepID=UPI000C1262DB|nr:ABC transporter permease [Solibacillus sp. R5-41]ATP38883.1 ABC transporter [Solibacillus sp. R5-41]
MNISIKRIQAIFMKDYKEFSRNFAVSSVMLVPLVLALVYGKSGSNSIQTYIFPINMTFSMVTAYMQACLIAEEKERNTLRSLMMSPASIADILLGKSVLVFIITAFILGFSMFLVGYTPENIPVLVAALAVSTVFYIGVGIICGLYTKTVMEASLASLPVMIIFSLAPLAMQLGETHIVYKIVQWLPSSQLLILAIQIYEQVPTMDLITPILVMFVWSVVAIIISVVLFKKRTKDE